MELKSFNKPPAVSVVTSDIGSDCESELGI